MTYLKYTIGLLAVLITLSWTTNDSDCKNSVYILEQAKKRSDAGQHWRKAEIKIHLQEPRIGNPTRSSKLVLNNAKDYFELERMREPGLVSMIASGSEKSSILLDGKEELSEELKEKYALNEQRVQGSRSFYKALYGVPMSITESFWEKIEPAQKAKFEGREVYRINLELKDAVVSKYWTLIVSVEEYKILAIEFNHPDDPDHEGEILIFHGEYEMNGMKIPRVRNWYAKGTNEYLGTDVIVKGLE